MRAATAVRTCVGAVGVAMLGFGAWNLLWHQHAQVGPPDAVGKWLLGGVIVHDAILAPLVFLACAVAWRHTGARVRRALALFLLAGGSLVIIALPDILRSGDNPNPTVTPLDYPRNLTITLGVLAFVAALTAAAGPARDRYRKWRQEARLRAQAKAEAEAKAKAEAEAEAANAKTQAQAQPQSDAQATIEEKGVAEDG